MESISLKRVPLSVRASNVLYRMGLSSVEDFMKIPIEEIAVQRNIGEKTLREIERVRGQIARGEFVFLEELPVPEELPSYKEGDLQEMAMHSIDELELSHRSYHALINAGLLHMDQLSTLSKEELSSLRNLGKKSQEEVQSELQRWLEENGFRKGEAEFEDEVEVSEEEKVYFQRIMHILDPFAHVYWKNLWKDAKTSDHWEEIVRGGWNALDEENWHAVFHLPILKSKLKFSMRHLMKDDMLKKEDFLDRCRNAAPLLDGELWMKYGLEEELLEEHLGFFLLKRERVSDILKNQEDNSREMQMVRLRLDGRSLHEVGDLFSLTKERVRQVVHRELESFPPLFEDYFAPVLEAFQWKRDDFSRLFPELEKVGAEYLFQRYKVGSEPLSEESAERYFGEWREKLMEYLKDEEVRKDQESASRVELLLRTLKNYSDVSLNYEELEEAYYDYLVRGGFPTEELKLHPRTIANHLRTVPNVVFDRQGKIRYCPVREDLIWECIDFEAYKDIVISAERIYRDYPELMVELDIRDGYELFYVLKWSLVSRPSDLFEIRCRRVPVIVMGEASEEEQALKLLRALAPVEQHDFYAAYEEIYGVRRDTAQGNPVISNAVAPYFINGTCSLAAAFIDEGDAALLSEKLKKKELWWTEELEELFDRICICSPKEAFNAAAFRKIGYILNSGYLFPAEYLTATRFFEERYLSDNVLDLSELENKLLHLPTFHSLLVKKKKELDFVEVSPKLLFSIGRIESLYGLTKAHLSELQEWLSRRFTKYFNGYSLWEEVKIHPYVQRLQGNKWMLTCIMRQKEDVTSLPVAGSIILSKDKTSLRISKICEWLVEMNGVMSLEELERCFNDTFGSRISHETFLEKLRETDIDRWTEKEEEADLSVVSDGEPELSPNSGREIGEVEESHREDREHVEVSQEVSISSEPKGGEDIIDGGGEMGKYEPLQEHLMISGLDEIRMSFLEMEEILGFELPSSARKYPAWWSNGGHSQSEGWIDAGYSVNGVDFINGEVRFVRDSAYQKPHLVVPEQQPREEERMSPMSNVVPIRTEQDSQRSPSFEEPMEDLKGYEVPAARSIPTVVPTELGGKKMTVEGHDFYFIQTLVPERELNGRIKRYYPQESYRNEGDLPLLEVGEGPFCRFSLQAGAWSGVYLWVADGEILYIGETINLANRFNVGYGHISPRNCYAGGQSTNCRMNKVVLDYFEKGKVIALFFCPTAEHKELEAELLSKRKTRFNIKGDRKEDE